MKKAIVAILALIVLNVVLSVRSIDVQKEIPTFPSVAIIERGR